MTAAVPREELEPPAPARPKHRGRDFDPADYRMPVGDHLEELRSRLFKALGGAFAAFFVCLLVAKSYLLPPIVAPLIEALEANDVNPQVFFTGVADPFMVYLRISMIGAFVLAGPWVIWQVWGFVASGLYPRERRAVTRYLPFAFLLFFGGIAFVWYVILPITLSFFLGWSMTIPLPSGYADAPPVPAAVVGSPVVVPSIPGNPESPVPLQLWFDTGAQRLKTYHDGHVRVIPFGSENLAAPMITLPDYVSLVLVLLVVFGLSFQLPLVVYAVIRTGLVEASALRGQRKLVYFVIVFLACAITPGDVLTATLGLIGPLILLFEAGIWLGARGRPEARPGGFEVAAKDR